jgi:hypothetical protein
MPPTNAVSRDTSPEARRVQRDAQRRLGGPGRVELAFQMCADAREIALAGMLQRDAGLGEADARARLLRRLLGNALYDAAYPPATA